MSSQNTRTHIKRCLRSAIAPQLRQQVCRWINVCIRERIDPACQTTPAPRLRSYLGNTSQVSEQLPLLWRGQAKTRGAIPVNHQVTPLEACSQVLLQRLTGLAANIIRCVTRK